MTYRLGTCCIITDSNQKNFGSLPDLRIGTVTIKSMQVLPPQKQRDKLSSKVLQNLKALHKQLSFIALQPVQLRMFRISSGLLPLFDHPEYNKLYDDKLLFVVDHWLTKCKQVIDTYNIRISAHPDQYCVINSDKDHVRQNAIRTLEYHKYFMERLTSVEAGAVINVHLNGKLDSLPEYDQLVSSGLTKWLSFENDDKGRADHKFTLLFCERYNIRYVYDLHHDYVQSGEWLDLNSSDFDRILNLWGSVRPKFHMSQSKEFDKVVRAHSDYINDADLINYVNDLLYYGDCMIEAKAKNLAVTDLYKSLTDL